MIIVGTVKKTGSIITNDGVPYDGTPGSGYSWWSTDGGRSVPGARDTTGSDLDDVFQAARNSYLEDVVELTEEGWELAQRCECGGTRRKGPWMPKRPPTPSPFGEGNNRKARKARQRAREMAQKRALERAAQRMQTFESEHGKGIDEIIRKDEERRAKRAEADRKRRAKKKGATGA